MLNGRSDVCTPPAAGSTDEVVCTLIVSAENATPARTSCADVSTYRPSACRPVATLCRSTFCAMPLKIRSATGSGRNASVL